MRELKLYFKDFIRRKGLYKIWFIFRNLPLVIAKYFNVLIMIIVFLISPSNLYRFSWRKWLPKPSVRDKSKSSLIDIYEPSITKNFEINMNNKVIYTKGYSRKIKYDKNSILLNHKVNLENRKAIFATSDVGLLKHYLKNDVDVIFNKLVMENDEGEITNFNEALDQYLELDNKIKVIELKLKSNLSGRLTFTSGIVAIIAFYLISKKLTVYGWNYYQNKSLSSMNIIEFIFKIFFFFADLTTTKEVESSLTHLYFAYFFKDLKNLKINGYLDYYKNVSLNKLMTKRLKELYLIK